MVHFYSVYIPVPAEKYIHILKGCLEKKHYCLILYFAKSSILNFAVIHSNAMGL